VFTTRSTNLQQPHRLLTTLVVTLSVGLLLTISGSGWSQFEGAPETGILKLQHPGGLMQLWVEAPELLSWDDDGTPVYWQRPASHFYMLTGSLAPQGGDPTKIGDENRPILSYPSDTIKGLYHFSSGIQFSIDQTNPDIEGQYVDLSDLMAAADTADSPAAVQDFWPIPLSMGVRDISGTARLPVNSSEEVATEQDDEDEDEDEEEPQAYIQVAHRYMLIYDGLMLELTVTNTDTEAHTVGVRVFYDTRHGKLTDQFDGMPIYLSDGTVINGERALPDAQHGLPDWWVSYANSDDSPTSVKGILDTQAITSSSGGLPDRIEFGVSSHLESSWFDFVPSSTTSLVGADWAYAVKWNERLIQPGHSVSFVSYIAYGASAADYDPTIAVGGYAPRQLVKQEGDDPATTVVEGPDHIYLSDPEGRSPFPIELWVDNFGTVPRYSAGATIELPDGLELWPTTQSVYKSLGTIGVNETKGVSWTVKATEARPGTAIIKLIGPEGKLVRCKVFIPALPILPPRESIVGLEMLSFPYEFANSDAEHVLASLGDLTLGGSDDPALIRWDPTTSRYRTFPNEFLTHIIPGEGYWVYNPNAVTIVLPDDAQEVSTDDAYLIDLPAGWNEIGCPFVLPVRFQNIQVLHNGQLWSMAEAVARNYIQPAVFSYNPATGEYEWEQQLSAIRLNPYEGYWVLARDAIQLIVPPPSGLEIASVPVVESGAEESNGWQVQLEVAGAGRVCTKRAFGVSEVAEEGLDRMDVPSPPTAAGTGVALQAEFVSPTHQAPPCLVDVRPCSQTEQTWYLAVTTDAPDQLIKVSWPSLEALPPDMVAILEDTASGQKIWMRTNSAYSYNSGEGGQRLLKISVRPVASVTPVVSQVAATAAPGGSWAISYTLSSAAVVQARIRNISGVVVKHLVSGELSEAGRNVVLWSGRSDRGTAVPNGRYLVEVEARSPDTGQTGRIISAFAVMR